MSSIIVFSKREKEIIYLLINEIRLKNEEEASIITKRMTNLFEMAKTVSTFPPINCTRTIGNSVFTLDTLINMICKMYSTDQIMYIPTKVIVGRSFVIAKINFLFMLKYESETYTMLASYIKKIDEYITLDIYGLMSEEVYLSLIQDEFLDMSIKKRAAMRLINIWEYRLSQSAEDYAPMLSSLWQSRKNLSPIYGTMLGMTETLQIAQNIDPLWFDFIKSSSTNDSVIQSLEEFLFNLTFEELNKIREIMLEKNISSINKKDITSLLKINNFYSDFQTVDPREMLQFFKQRKKNADYRNKARIPGPHKTIEEYILLFMLKKEQVKHF